MPSIFAPHSPIGVCRFGCKGGRGTCSVFTMVGALEYALAREQQHGTALSIEIEYLLAYVNDSAWVYHGPKGGPMP